RLRFTSLSPPIFHSRRRSSLFPPFIPFAVAPPCFHSSSLLSLLLCYEIMSYAEFHGTSSNRSRRSPISSDTASPSCTNVPETANSAPQAVMTIEDFVSQPGRQHIPRLHPKEENGATWFNLENGITKSILRIFKTQLGKPFPTYGDVDPDTKLTWFKSFAQDFNWEPGLSKRVRLEFDIQVNTSYGNHMYSWKQKWKNGKEKPKDLEEGVWRGFIRYWSMEKTKATSTQNSKNRKSERGGKGMATHNAGSMSFKRHERKMAIKNGVQPDWLQVMEETHTSKKTGQIQDLVIEERIERIKLRKVDRETQLSQDGSTSSTGIPREEINLLCIEEIPLTKGRRPGLGSLVSKDGSVSSVFPRDTELVQQVEDLNRVIKEKDAVVEELKQQNVEIKEKFAETQVTLTNLQTFLASQFPGQFPPP
ncbi:unnamed protein product, partial [Arabidopsis halleri]